MKNLKIFLGVCVLALLSGTVSAQTTTASNELSSFQQNSEQLEIMELEMNGFYGVEYHKKNRKNGSFAKNNDIPFRERRIDPDPKPEVLTVDLSDSK